MLDLFGTWREMRRQYGSLASSQLKEMYAKVFDDRLLKFGTKNRERMETIARDFYRNYPYRLRELLAGMAETSGLDFEKHLLLNAVQVIVADELWGNPPATAQSFHCTGIAVWGEYSAGPLIYGRNYDYQD